MMDQMMIAYEPGTAIIMPHDAANIDEQEGSEKGRPMHIKDEERNKESEALQHCFNPVSSISIIPLGFDLLMMNGMDAIQGSCMQKQMGEVEPDIIAEDGSKKEQHTIRYSMLLIQIYDNIVDDAFNNFIYGNPIRPLGSWNSL